MVFYGVFPFLSFRFLSFLSFSIVSGLSYACVLVAPAACLVDIFRHTPRAGELARSLPTRNTWLPYFIRLRYRTRPHIFL